MSSLAGALGNYVYGHTEDVVMHPPAHALKEEEEDGGGGGGGDEPMDDLFGNDAGLEDTRDVKSERSALPRLLWHHLTSLAVSRLRHPLSQGTIRIRSHNQNESAAGH